MRIAALLGVIAGTVMAEPKTTSEIFARVAETYQHLTAYDFELQEYAGSGRHDARFAAILPGKFFIQTLPDDTRCITDGDTTWRYLSKQSADDGRTPMHPPHGPDEKRLCELDFAGARYSFVDRWKKISEWAPLAEILTENSIAVDGTTFHCWVIEIHQPATGEFTELWIDKSRYLVLQELYLNRAKGFDLRRQWTKIQIDSLPDARLFAPGKLPDGRYANGMVGKPAPDFTFTDSEGTKVAMRSLRGKAVVLYFWPANPVNPEGYNPIAMIRNLFSDPAFEDAQFVAVLPVKSPALPEFMRRNGIKMPAAPDADRRIRGAYQVGRFAQVIVIGPDGIVIRDFRGRVDEGEIRSVLDDLL
jgi:peroxiredoxin Q/BCP